MAKTHVVKQPQGDRTPFLRGILIQSLLTAGLGFEDAYRTAQKVRDELRNVSEISNTALRARVAELLEKEFGSAEKTAYTAEPEPKTDIIVHTPTRSAPFSIGILAHSLESCAIPPDAAVYGARKILASVQQTGHKEIDHKSLRRIIYRCLHDHCDAAMAERYLSWRRFENSGRPLIILIGGTTGSGKSTIASEIAYRTDIARVQSTDMMREVIRAYLTPDAVPTLGYSSFEAWRGLQTAARKHDKKIPRPVVAGFRSQFSAIQPALRATLARAVQETQDLIIEGVHVVPAQMDLSKAREAGVVVPLMLASLDKTLLQKQLKRRGREKSERKASRYLDGLDDIWELQSYLLSDADNLGIPIIQNLDVESTVREVLELVSTKIIKKFPPRLEDIDKDSPAVLASQDS
jgi:2-phosphoglycerate kinase